MLTILIGMIQNIFVLLALSQTHIMLRHWGRLSYHLQNVAGEHTSSQRPRCQTIQGRLSSIQTMQWVTRWVSNSNCHIAHTRYRIRFGKSCSSILLLQLVYCFLQQGTSQYFKCKISRTLSSPDAFLVWVFLSNIKLHRSGVQELWVTM